VKPGRLLMKVWLCCVIISFCLFWYCSPCSIFMKLTVLMHCVSFFRHCVFWRKFACAFHSMCSRGLS
jgi:hypothetical protein